MKTEIKSCVKCLIEKSLEEFYKCKKSKGGYRTICKKCSNEYGKEKNIKIKNGEYKPTAKLNSSEFQLFMFKRCGSCKDEKTYLEYKEPTNNKLSCYCAACEKERARERYEENKDHIKIRVKEWQRNNKDKSRESRRISQRERRLNNPKVKIIDKSRKLLREHMFIYPNSTNHANLIGCSNVELRARFESLFLDGMNWDNYGSVWVIDHIIPIASFDVENREELLKANHYSNLRPYWKDVVTDEQKKLLEKI